MTTLSYCPREGEVGGGRGVWQFSYRHGGDGGEGEVAGTK